MVGPIDVKQKENESTGWYADEGAFDLDLWPWIFKANCISGMGGAIVMEWKRRESIACPNVKHNHCDLKAEDTFRDRGDLRCRRFHRLA